MNITTIRQRPQWLLIGIIVSAALIGGVLRVLWPQDAPNSSTTASTPITTEAEETPQVFESPMISLSAELRKAATPSELVRSTASDERLSGVMTGRADPFAPITQSIGAHTSSRQEETANNTAAPQIAVSADRAPVSPNLPTTSISQVPDLPPVPTANVTPPSLPAIPMAANPLPIPNLPSSLPGANAQPQSPIETVELTGIVQVGDRVGVIVREGNGQTSRHVFAGDLLAGGQVRLKSVDLSSQQPLVILEYQGKEYTRIVG
ncbi:hypothetical protein [Leptolyngbya iicbica]|uniref:Uncharacterized protein n=2 Tax=Cyanophyceae TaxID=3028117 RepID=A0A4Q7E8X2_9CYAN|nr:hypothetical protein [Leptolyngbya sp. LK]RZM77301.1 hypothetical protein DYY88_16800 [Leptolyngbya sp. LK]